MRATRNTAGLAVALAVALAATPALAHGGHDRGAAYYPAPVQNAFRVDAELAARCGLGAGSMRPIAYAPHHDGFRHDDGRGGALIGGLVGGVLGNRIAGHGDRTLGTVAGAAVGAVAGAAIDRAEDRGAEHRHDGPEWTGPEPAGAAGCDAVLPPGYMLVAVPGGQDCRDEVTTTEEWVPEYVTVPGRAPRAAPLRDKRTKLRRVK